MLYPHIGYRVLSLSLLIYVCNQQMFFKKAIASSVLEKPIAVYLPTLESASPHAEGQHSQGWGRFLVYPIFHLHVNFRLSDNE